MAYSTTSRKALDQVKAWRARLKKQGKWPPTPEMVNPKALARARGEKAGQGRPEPPRRHPKPDSPPKAKR